MATHLPKISIVTPSFNQGKFIEQTILSVIGQGYPNLEYIIVDGGSTDKTTDIIKKYEEHIAFWISEPDNGQSNAINKGFEKSTGEIFGWINSDDYYLPGILTHIAKFLDPTKETLISGNVFHYYENTRKAWCGYSSPKELKDKNADHVTQPGSFWTRKAWQKVGGVNEHSHFLFDMELLMNAKSKNIQFIRTEEYLAVYRMHNAHKSGSGGKKRQLEFYNLYKKYYSQDMAESYAFVCENISDINATIQYLKKYKLSRFRNLVLKLKFPKTMSKYKSLLYELDTFLAAQ